MSRRIIITGDDFGLSLSVNEAIERAHRDGILGAASLMVAEPAADDAIRRARALPSLKVGLHLALVRGRSVLPAQQIPDLVNAAGRLRDDLAGAGFNYFFRASARRQLEAEMRAQFERFKASGLALDHVDGHCHLHLHPTILGTLLKIGPEYGMKSVRVPYEPFLPSWRATHSKLRTRFGHGVLLLPLLARMRNQLRRAGLATNDYLFGINDTGHLTAQRVLALLQQMPDGISELHFHPSSDPADEENPDRLGFEPQAELETLVDPRVAQALDAAGFTRTTYSDLDAA